MLRPTSGAGCSKPLVGALLAFFIILLCATHTSQIYETTILKTSLFKQPQRPLDPPNHHQANSTLGFEHIFAVSSENQTDPTAWRQKGMAAAAQRTNLTIEVFAQRERTLKEFLDFRNAQHGERDGQVLAWMAHLEVLEHIVANNISSALILEDDADWDVTVRKVLAPSAPIPAAIRNLTDADESVSTLDAPYGNSWELLWLGHCLLSENEGSGVVVIDDDDTMLPNAEITDLLGNHPGTEDYQRKVVSKSGAICTFAYAVSLEGAKKIIKESQYGGEAYDVAMNSYCREQQLSCVTVSPEVFNQQEGGGKLIDYNHDSSVDLEDDEIPELHTPNIMYSARCNAGRAEDDLVECSQNPEEDVREDWQEPTNFDDSEYADPDYAEYSEGSDGDGGLELEIEEIEEVDVNVLDMEDLNLEDLEGADEDEVKS